MKRLAVVFLVFLGCSKTATSKVQGVQESDYIADSYKLQTLESLCVDSYDNCILQKARVVKLVAGGWFISVDIKLRSNVVSMSMFTEKRADGKVLLQLLSFDPSTVKYSYLIFDEEKKEASIVLDDALPSYTLDGNDRVIKLNVLKIWE